MTKDTQIKKLKEIIVTQEKDIGHLSEMNRLMEENLERLSKRNQELVAVEEGTFLHSPTYLQMKEQIRFLNNRLNSLETEVAFEKGMARKQDAMVNQIFEDNKKLTSEKADEEYFVGITENYYDAWEYKKLTESNIKLSAQVETQKDCIKARDAEIERLQMQVAEYKILEKRGMSVSEMEKQAEKFTGETLYREKTSQDVEKIKDSKADKRPEFQKMNGKKEGHAFTPQVSPKI